jgi:hypothetical protein
MLIVFFVLLFDTPIATEDRVSFSQLAGRPAQIHQLPSTVPTNTMVGLVLAGYQGWFRTPNDDDNFGWWHWTKQRGHLNPSLISEDYWPELAEFTPAEQHAAPGFTYADGSQAKLFSSDNSATVLRHFQWMQAYHIDGVALQRFGVELQDRSRLRVLSYCVDAAEKTGRVIFVEYDLSGMTESSIVPELTADWHNLVDKLQITSNPRYLHEGGKPVVGIFGFYLDRFSSDTANAILDIFQKPGPYQAFVAGAGEWFWRSDPKLTPAWIQVFYRMNSWQPWNAGNVDGDDASTGYWRADMLDFGGHDIIYVPEIYPGMSTDNRDSLPPGKGRIARRRGDFFWNQFAVATSIGARTAFIGMFDELDEGTQIIKVLETPPAQASFINYEGLPSDSYLCWAGLGSKMITRKIPYNSTTPNCTALTQPTIPEAVYPLSGSRVQNPFSFSWRPALTLEHGKDIDHYEILLGSTIYEVPASARLLTEVILPAKENYEWRVRAVNSLGNPGGWSLLNTFSVQPTL